MPDVFLDIVCKNQQKNTPLECRHHLGGPSLDTIFSHDFSVSPFVDIRYCPKCRVLIRTTIKSVKEAPVIEAVTLGVDVEFKSLEEVFGFVEVHRNVRGGR